jgi:hypothetical protein
MINKILSYIALGFLAFVLALAAQGGETPTETPAPKLTGEAGVTITNAYVFNGLVQNKGFITQPYVTLNYSINDNVSLSLPFWASIHRDRWYELDISPQVSFTKGDVTIAIGDYIYTSPAGDFQMSHNLSLALSYTDKWGLNPHVYFQQELSGHAGLNRTGGKGQYYEVGIAPSRTFREKSEHPVTVSLPVAAGFGTNGFYGQGFGFMSIGPDVSIPIAGSWTATAGARYYRLGHCSANNTNHGEKNLAVFSLTVGTEF